MALRPVSQMIQPVFSVANYSEIARVKAMMIDDVRSLFLDTVCSSVDLKMS